MSDRAHASDPPAADPTAGRRDAPKSAPGPDGGPALPSRKAIAALAATVLLASIGLGAALPSRRIDSLEAAARSSLSASLLGAIAADRVAADRPVTQAPSQPAAASSTGSATASAQAPTTGSKGVHAAGTASAEAGGTQGTPAGTPEAEAGSGGSAGAPASSAGGSSSSHGESTPAPVSPALLSQIAHVWLIVLSGASFQEALAHRRLDPYLAGQLVPNGALLTRYSLIAGGSLANDLALLSGQGSNPETERDCPSYTALTPARLDARGLASGTGCVYPASVKTLADQVSAAALTWRAYIQDMAPAAAGSQTGSATSPTCRHPQLGGSESSGAPSVGEDYLTARNPFVYFDSLIENEACANDDVDLGRLGTDLATAAQPPSFSWIAPSACDDGARLACGAGSPSGLAAADALLRKLVPQILATAAYRRHGLILITFDAGLSGGSRATVAPANGPNPPGRRRVGALVVSPFVRAGARVNAAFNTYSLLKSLERLFGVPLLGHAADEGVTELDARVYRTASNTTSPGLRLGGGSHSRAADGLRPSRTPIPR